MRRLITAVFLMATVLTIAGCSASMQAKVYKCQAGISAESYCEVPSN